jgi:hypothetical protein
MAELLVERPDLVEVVKRIAERRFPIASRRFAGARVRQWRSPKVLGRRIWMVAPGESARFGKITPKPSPLLGGHASFHHASLRAPRQRMHSSEPREKGYSRQTTRTTTLPVGHSREVKSERLTGVFQFGEPGRSSVTMRVLSLL